MVTQPLDLGTVGRRLAAGAYADASSGHADPDCASMDAFCADVLLVFENARLYNGRANPVSVAAASLRDAFNTSFAAARAALAAAAAARAAKQESMAPSSAGAAAAAAAVAAYAGAGGADLGCDGSAAAAAMDTSSADAGKSASAASAKQSEKPRGAKREDPSRIAFTGVQVRSCFGRAA